jgi:hypothetical protein
VGVIMRAKGLFLSSLFWIIPSAAFSADPDVLMQAVSFAVTGSDATKVVAVDRAQCIFKVGEDTYGMGGRRSRIRFEGASHGL